jgi:hypothetical protein
LAASDFEKYVVRKPLYEAVPGVGTFKGRSEATHRPEIGPALLVID